MKAKVTKYLEILRDSKNLLAFSGGVDSSCLFFLLLRENIDFDLAIIHYNVRKEAKKEIKYAQKLAKKYHKKIFVLNAEAIKSNFECNARQVRYAFFEEIIARHSYQNLILAHQLNDRLEWLLMQLSKGCGLNSLLGFSAISEVKTQSHLSDCSRIYRIVRPMSEVSRDEIVAFLKKHKIKFFIDKSNEDSAFKRNYFRKHFSNKLIKNFKSGILKSFHYLYSDFLALYGESEVIEIGDIVIFRRFLGDSNLAKNLQNLAKIDNVAKRFGYVISKKQRDEILKSGFSCILGDKIIIDSNKSHIFITKIEKCDSKNHPQNRHKSAKNTAKDSALYHSKAFRERLRIAKIPPKIRPFIDEKTLGAIVDSTQ